jgi:hypothetical protein
MYPKVPPGNALLPAAVMLIVEETSFPLDTSSASQGEGSVGVNNRSAGEMVCRLSPDDIKGKDKVPGGKSAVRVILSKRAIASGGGDGWSRLIVWHCTPPPYRRQRDRTHMLTARGHGV